MISFSENDNNQIFSLLKKSTEEQIIQKSTTSNLIKRIEDAIRLKQQQIARKDLTWVPGSRIRNRLNRPQNRRNKHGYFVATDTTIRHAVHLWITDRTECISKYGHICTWDTSSVTDMSRLFENAKDFKDAIGSWDTSNVRTIKDIFNETTFHQSIFNWNLINLTDKYIVNDETIRTAVKDWINNKPFAFLKYGPIHTWDTSQVTNMYNLFYRATAFNENINTWNVSKVTNMSYMFHNATSFNQSLTNWNVSNVTTMTRMFYNANSFNKSLLDWNVHNVKDMSYMFYRASRFNQPINNWNISKVNDLA